MSFMHVTNRYLLHAYLTLQLCGVVICGYIYFLSFLAIQHMEQTLHPIPLIMQQDIRPSTHPSIQHTCKAITILPPPTPPKPSRAVNLPHEINTQSHHQQPVPYSSSRSPASDTSPPPADSTSPYPASYPPAP